MNRLHLCLVGGLTLAALTAAPSAARADITFTTNQGALNDAGLPVNAKVDFTIKKGQIVARVSNTTKNISSADQTITSLSFTVLHRPAKGALDFAHGFTRQISPLQITTSHELENLPWTLSASGSTYTLKAPGTRYAIIPDTASYPRADPSLLKSPARNPFVAGTAVFQIQIPDIELTDDLIGVSFHYGDELADGLPRITGPAEDATPSSTDPLNNADALNFPGTVGVNPVTPHDVGSGGDISGAGSAPPNSHTPGGGTTPPPPERQLPSDPTPPAVPEPASAALLALGAGVWFFRKKRIPPN